MTTLENLTPHDVVILDPDDVPVMTVPRSAHGVARVQEVYTASEVIEADGVPCTVATISYGSVDPPLPPYRPEVLLIVSSLVIEARPDRADLVFPSGLVRDQAGNPIGCRFLGRRS